MKSVKYNKFSASVVLFLFVSERGSRYHIFCYKVKDRFEEVAKMCKWGIEKKYVQDFLISSNEYYTLELILRPRPRAEKARLPFYQESTAV